MDITAHAIESLAGPGVAVLELVAPRSPGLYAVYGDSTAHHDLGIAGDPSEPVYVGKAEKSLYSRDIRTHFHPDLTKPAKTGSSTLRRTIAALLRDQLGLTPRPRSASGVDSVATFTLSAHDDIALTKWMHEHLRVALWVAPATMPELLRDVERGVISHWQPRLNLTHVEQPWQQLRDARAAMARDARPAT